MSNRPCPRWAISAVLFAAALSVKTRWISVFAVLALSASWAPGAEVLWGVMERTSVVREGNETHSTFEGVSGLSQLQIAPWISIICSKSSDVPPKVSIRADDVIILTCCDSWVLMEEGDLVEASTTRGLNSYFLHGFIDGTEGTYDVRADEEIEGLYYRTFRFYLGFATAADLWLDGYPVWDRVYYGWAEFEYRNGAIDLVASALNTEANGGIYVGTDRTTTPVPEPASAALALFGTALLLRRRLRTPMS